MPGIAPWSLELQELPQDAAPAASLPLPAYRGRVATSVKQFLQQACSCTSTNKAADPLSTGLTLMGPPAAPSGSTLSATSQSLSTCPDAVSQLLAHLWSSPKIGQLGHKASGLLTQHGSISKQDSRSFKRLPSPTLLMAHGRKRLPKRAALE